MQEVPSPTSSSDAEPGLRTRRASPAALRFPRRVGLVVLVVVVLAAAFAATLVRPKTRPAAVGSTAESAMESMLPKGGGGPLRALPWSALRAGDWDTRTYTISTAGPELRAVVEALDVHLQIARLRAISDGNGLPEAHAKLVIADWQPGLKRVALRLFWRAEGQPERMLERSTFLHESRDNLPWSRRHAEDIEDGAELFAAACAGCHGVAGRGIPGVAPPLDDPRALALRATASQARGSVDDYVEAVVAEGRPTPGPPYSRAMPGWSERFGGPLSRHALRSVVAYVRNWHGEPTEPGTAPSPDSATSPAGVAVADGAPTALGAALYGASDCLGCHGWPGSGGVTGPDLAGFSRRSAQQMPGTDAESALRVAILAPSAFLAAECPTGPCADMMPRDYGARLSPRDFELLVRYISSVDDVMPRAARPGAPPPLVAGLADTTATPSGSSKPLLRGRSLYVAHCAMCHGDRAQGGMGSAMTTALASVDAVGYARAATAQGVPGMMPAWDEAVGGPLTASDLDDVAAYVVDLARR